MGKHLEYLKALLKEAASIEVQNRRITSILSFLIQMRKKVRKRKRREHAAPHQALPPHHLVIHQISQTSASPQSQNPDLGQVVDTNQWIMVNQENLQSLDIRMNLIDPTLDHDMTKDLILEEIVLGHLHIQDQGR